MGDGRGQMRAADAGVTLIEILIVLVLIGVGAGVVTLALPSGSSARSLTQESTLLVSRLNIAAERSLIGGRPYRLEWSTTGYLFQLWDGESWLSAPNAPLAEPHTLDANVSLVGLDNSQTGRVTITPDLLPARTGLIKLTMRAGSAHQSIQFDGATARTAIGTS